MSCHRALRTRRFIPKARPSLITCHTLALLAPRHEGSSFCGGLLPFVLCLFIFAIQNRGRELASSANSC